ncbi:hypothetical protein PTTG_28981 [Puccinia triticina 1-1 BBBD Race 1]|uniref:Uncharacterized protein n=1 Tax=Puccinia triticina (isolate 1-1 / race 1 (BBBD)) TaxID=630390 RepID=A0A180G7C1_PUCT1|nr:hypothetical protein PTTG_28981 [Puccinia triticina 1-1 BBBD Race 1]
MQNSHHQRHQNPSRLKSLTENLRLRLKYAKLKVLNGWHHQTLNEIEKTFYYLKLPKQQPSKTQQHSSPSTTTTISSASIFPPPAPQPSQRQPSPACPFKLPHIPASTVPQLAPHSPLHPIRASKHCLQRNSTQDPSDEQQQPVPSSALRSSTNTTFSLPSKYSTPFRKIIRAGGTASGQLTTNESNIFWPTGPFTSSSSSTGSPSSSSRLMIRGTTTSSKRQRKSPEGLFFKLGGSTTVERLKNNNNNNNNNNQDSSREREDLFKDSMDEYKELYKHSSPASFLFNNHYRPLRASVSSSSSSTSPSKPTPSPSFFNHPLDLLNSISPVRIRSHLHADLHRPRSQTLLRLAASELVSPSPNRSHSHLNKIFASNSRPTLSPNNDQNQPGEEEEEGGEEGDKENTTQTPSLPTTRTSPISFSLHPRPPRLSSNPARDPPPHTLLDHEDVEETAAGVDQIGLDELDQMNWE